MKLLSWLTKWFTGHEDGDTLEQVAKEVVTEKRKVTKSPRKDPKPTKATTKKSSEKKTSGKKKTTKKTKQPKEEILLVEEPVYDDPLVKEVSPVAEPVVQQEAPVKPNTKKKTTKKKVHTIQVPETVTPEEAKEVIAEVMEKHTNKE